MPFAEHHLAQIASFFEVVVALSPAERAAAIELHGATIRAVLSNGTTGLTSDASVHHFMLNATRHFAGEPVLTPV